MLKRALVAGAAIAACLTLAAPADATVYYSGFTTANSPTGYTPVVDITAPSASSVEVYVQDCCLVGDYYATYVDGSYVGTTPYEPEYGSNSGYPNSTATFTAKLIGGDSHSFYLVDQTTYLLPAGVYVEISSVPEPATWSLMLTGVFGLGAALRSRKSRLMPREASTA